MFAALILTIPSGRSISGDHKEDLLRRRNQSSQRIGSEYRICVWFGLPWTLQSSFLDSSM